MNYDITIPSSLRAVVQLPSSKSISNRVLIINALANGKEEIRNLSDCDDTRVMIEALSGEEHIIDIMAAGTAMRFLTAYYSVAKGEHYLTGTKRMQQRPIWVLVDALRRLGAEIEYAVDDGYPPLFISGKKMTGDKIALQGDVSSQYISALLMIAPMLKNGLNLFLIGKLISRPYIDLTIQLMKEFGADVSWTTDSSIVARPRPYKSIPYKVESDWSAASYWYELVALAEDAKIELLDLQKESLQGDSRVAELFESLGVETLFTDRGVVLRKTGKRVSFLEVDFLDIPDLAQTFVVTCALLGVHFRFTGLQSLRIKETDRIHALITEMSRIGFVIKEEPGSTLVWNGERTELSGTPSVSTYEDHRMAMAFAPAAISLPLQIKDIEVVTKSYPRFWDDLKEAGAHIEPSSL